MEQGCDRCGSAYFYPDPYQGQPWERKGRRKWLCMVVHLIAMSMGLAPITRKSDAITLENKNLYSTDLTFIPARLQPVTVDCSCGLGACTDAVVSFHFFCPV
jgi:hypothetical protein